jgi:hypothetical protein
MKICQRLPKHMARARISKFESSHPSHAVRSLWVVSKQSPYRAFGCFSLLILNDRAAPSYQLLDLSLAGLPLDRLFLDRPTS